MEQKRLLVDLVLKFLRLLKLNLLTKIRIMKFAFEKLTVWHQARSLSKDVYELTMGFPDSERYGLTNQMRRASISVCSNIAEGTGRFSQNDKKRFFSMAYSSLLELMNQLIISYDLGLLEKKDLEAHRINIEEISRMLNALHKNVPNQ